ncbi:MAG: DNA repair protein RecN [Ignavibacteriales bacterium CG12_big_fil_rev_8_21_14_0_65_30_8]|nr:MAG: DNA repair protein RecN [Ignavibacteriales bacterium CG12_big_fil_rev_8_21_14_0_65_30_8]
MLKSLEIKDYALIEHLNVEFGTGLNIITGETGAGKSIIVDAMGLLLGGRASTEVVRKGALKSFVEGIFNVEKNKKVHSLLKENELGPTQELIIRREISLKGANRCFVNDSPVPLTFINQIGDLLIDIHGQHEHQSLLRTETHIEFLDQYVNHESLLNDYRKSFKEFQNKISELNSFKEKEKTLNEKKDLYSFQIKEIDSVAPNENEDEKINKELKILENSEKLLELTTSIYDLLYNSENSVQDVLGEVNRKLSELTIIDKTFSEIEGENRNVLSQIKDISDSIRSYNSKIEVQPEQVEELRSRLGAINLLKKKYGGSIYAVIEHRKKIGEELSLAENFSEKINEIEKQIKKLRDVCKEKAFDISSKRKAKIPSIEKNVNHTLNELGIAHSSFKVMLTHTTAEDDNFILDGNKKIKITENGCDEVEFFISTNIGEDVKPLIKVASGGEISRVMLALKSVLAKTEALPVLIFDEIDTGISGRIAQRVGESLCELSKSHQIIAITHLPQIAANANYHYAVNKKLVGERVVSSIVKLDKEKRVEEIAKLMSGEIITEASIKGAKEMIKN